MCAISETSSRGLNRTKARKQQRGSSCTAEISCDPGEEEEAVGPTVLRGAQECSCASTQPLTGQGRGPGSSAGAAAPCLAVTLSPPQGDKIEFREVSPTLIKLSGVPALPC